MVIKVNKGEKKVDCENKFTHLIETINRSAIKYQEEFIRKVINCDNSPVTLKMEESNKVSFRNLNISERVSVCTERLPQTFKFWDEVEFEKGYKYTYLYTYTNIDVEGIYRNARNIMNLNYTELNQQDSHIITGKIYKETDECIYLKFHKLIEESVVEEDRIKRYTVRYPSLVVIHKGLNLIDIRFNKLNHNKDTEFYETLLFDQRDWIKTELSCDLQVLELGKIMSYIVANCSLEVVEDSCSLGFEKQKGVVLNYGSENIMPLIGELEKIIDERAEFNATNETMACKKIIKDYIFNRKELSSKHYRVLRWIHNKNIKDITSNDIQVKVSFNYRDQSEDLITFLEGKYNNMETMDYVTRYINSIKRHCE